MLIQYTELRKAITKLILEECKYKVQRDFSDPVFGSDSEDEDGANYEVKSLVDKFKSMYFYFKSFNYE